MSDGDGPWQAAERGFIEDVGHQSHASVKADAIATGGSDPGALLPTVLEGEQSKKGEPRHIFPWSVNSKDAT